MNLSFYGGARTVTGSNVLLDTGDHKILIDCGLFQGCFFCEDRNYDPFPYNPKEIDAVLVTHAHVDHTGRIPKLFREGFRGKVFATPPTRDLTGLVWEDSEGILREEAERAGREALFSTEDFEHALRSFEAVPYHEAVRLDQNLSFSFKDAGHILGSAIVEIQAHGKTLVFSGDLGNPPTPLLRLTEYVTRADYVVIETTYGDRIHEDRSRRKDILEDMIEETISRGGVLMIPAFALERTQELLYELNEFVENKRIPKIPIFIDSPLAINATEIYKKYPDYYNREATSLLGSGDRLFQFPGLTLTKTVEESKAINDVPPPKVIIAGSGMSTGGRILHHEKRYLPDEKNLLLIISYQAAGTLGRRILKGEREVRIHGERVPVRARVKAIGGYSAHADQHMLLEWLRHVEKPVEKVFAVHGEEAASLAFIQKVRDRLGLDAQSPMIGDTVEL